MPATTLRAMKNPNMTREQREVFLAEVHVGVLSVAEAGRGPCAVPIWYGYTPGGVVRMTAGASSRKVALLRTAGRASLCVQQEALPNKYVSVEGPVEIHAIDASADQRSIAVRYLGPKLAERYLATMAAGLADELLITLHPERWWSVDFSQVTLT
jgi:nitroimidazol reductase NimA-like FMN-containing flavoprotein (pyridoxamine 5'-phosphate oxidase superfamily)